MQRVGELGVVELADPLGDLLDDVDGGVALDAVVVGRIGRRVERGVGLLPVGEHLGRGVESGVGAGAVGGAGLGQRDRRRRAEHVAAVERLVERLGLDLVEEGRGLDLGHEDEDRVGLAPGELGHLGRQVGLVGLHLDVELPTSMPTSSKAAT